jgi:hypothetical protein
MPATLFLNALMRVDQQKRSIRGGSSGYHILQKLFMPGRVDDDVVAPTRFEPDLGDIDRNVLIPFRLEGIHKERPFKRHPATATDGLDLLEFPLRQRSGFV